MTAERIMRQGAVAAVIAGVLGLAGDLYHVTQDRVETSALFKVHGLLLIAALISAVIALVGLQLRQSAEPTAPGGVGYWLALVGTVLVAGDIYYEVAVQPRLAEEAARFLDGDPKGWHLVVVITSFALFGAGWLLTGISLARSRLFGAAPGITLAVGGFIAFTPLPGSYMVWSIGLVLLGTACLRSDRLRLEPATR